MTTHYATSADGTPIAFERQGAGPAIVMIDAAGGSLAAGRYRNLAALLEDDFTVYQSTT